MGDVSLFVGGRHYDVTCRDGDESRLEQLAAMIDAKVRRTTPGVNEVRQLLFAALFLADELNDIKAGETPPPPPPAPAEAAGTDLRLAEALESLANRVESLALRLAALPENA